MLSAVQRDDETLESGLSRIVAGINEDDACTAGHCGDVAKQT